MVSRRCGSCKTQNELTKLAFMPRFLCKRCFCSNLERRVRKHLRGSSFIKKGKKVVVIDDGSKESQMIFFILKGLKFPFELKFPKKRVPGFEIVENTNLLDHAVGFFEAMATNKLIKKKKSFAPLEVVHPDEIDLFCEFKKLPGKRSKPKGGIVKALKEIEKDHPQVLFSVLNFKLKIFRERQDKLNK